MMRRAVPTVCSRALSGEPAAPAVKTEVPGPKSKELMQDLVRLLLHESTKISVEAVVFAGKDSVDEVYSILRRL